MARSSSGKPTLFIIGGAEDRVGKAVVLRRFVRLAGGRRSRIVIIPTASSFQHEVVEAYTEVFTRLGAQHISVVNPEDRQEAHDPQATGLIDQATGIFMSGGSQLKLSQRLPGTPLGDAIHRAHDRGAVVGGTSAGASIMSQFMISMGDEGITPRQRNSQLSAGSGSSRASSSTSTSGSGPVRPAHVDGRRLAPPHRHRHRRGHRHRGRRPEHLHRPRPRRGVRPRLPGRCLGRPGGAAGGSDDGLGGGRAFPPAGATFDLRDVRLVDFVEKHPDVAVALASDRA